MQSIKNDNYVALTHNDGDALASLCVVDRVLQPEKWFFTCYSDLGKVMADLSQYCLKNRVANVLIADVSFAGKRKYVVDLTRTLAKIRHDFKLLIFDHHTYPENFWKGIRADVHIDQSRSACRGLFNHYSSTNNLFDLSQFIIDMNAFDMFNIDQERFEEALIFNDFIRAYCNGDSSKIEDLGSMLASWTPKYGYQYIMGKYRQDYKNKFQAFKIDCLEKKVMVRSSKGKKITILMVPDYFNMFVYTELKRGQDAIVCATNNAIRVRLRKDLFSTEQIRALKTELVPGNPEIGHPCAFPILLASSKPDQVVEMIAMVCETINKY